MTNETQGVMVTQTQLLTAAQIGKIINLSKRQVFRLKSSGKLPKSVAVGGSIRWRATDIQLWLECGCPNQEIFETRKAAARR